MSGVKRAPKVSAEVVDSAEAVPVAANASDSHVRDMVDNMPLNVMLTDLDLTIRYANKASLDTLRRLEAYLPVTADKVVGSSIDIFHKHPAHQRALLADPANLPHQAKVHLGPEILHLRVSAIHDAVGNYVGPMVTWAVITEQVEQETALAALEAERRAIAEELSTRTNALTQCVAGLTAGDLTAHVPDLGDDDLGKVATGIRDLVGTLRGSLEQIGGTAAGLAGAAEELAATTWVLQENVSGTSDQAGALITAVTEVDSNMQAVASAAEQMTASISEIARNTSQASAVAQDAVQMAAETDDTISSLGDASNEIGEVIRVITSIAQQTNLLALNATIEAARAGEAGRGFAVVANEVKELAKETGRATQDIGRKIETIQETTARAVEAIRGISDIIRQISNLQDNIASAVEEQSAVTTEISRSAAVAADSTRSIIGSTDTVASGAQEAQVAVNEISLATSELSRMAAELETLVRRFHT